MSTLVVANLHLESTANNRIEYEGSNTVAIYAGGVRVVQANSSSASISGHPTIGINSIIRYNSKVLSETIEISANKVTCTANASANTILRGTNDGFLNGMVVVFETDNTLPAGLAVDTEYYVINVAATSLKVTTTYNGTEIDITDSGTGNHEIYEAINARSIGPIENQGTVTIPYGSSWLVEG